MEWLLGTAGAVVIIGAAIKFMVGSLGAIRRVYRELEGFLSDWRGEPNRPGFRERPGIPQRVAAIEDRLSAIEEQLVEVLREQQH